MAKVRLAIAAWLAWIAAKIAPEPINHLFENFCVSCQMIPSEIKMGRTGGVLIGGWSIDAKGRAMCEAQVMACLDAAQLVRKAREVTDV